MFRHIVIQGDPITRGKSYGEQAADLIDLSTEVYKKGFAEKGYAWDDVIAVGEAFADRIRLFDADMYTELQGIAEGAGRRMGEVVALNARTELLYGAKTPPAGGHDDISGEGCTGAIALSGATASGHVIHGQNWDWREESADFTIVLEVLPERGPNFITLVEAGTLARCGLNDAGLAVTGNFLKATNEVARNGIPAPFIRRKILMAENFHDGLSAVIGSERSFSINVMVSHGDGEAVNFETTPEKLFWLRAENDLIVHSNHFLSQGAIATYQDMALQVTPDTLYRDVRVRRSLETRLGRLTIDDFKEAFADKWGAPYSVCRSPAKGPGGDSSATLATVIMDVTAGEMFVASKPYDKPQFQSFSLFNQQKNSVAVG